MKTKIINLLILLTSFLVINSSSTSTINHLNDNSIDYTKSNNFYLNQDISKILEIIQMVNETLILGYLEDLF